MKLNAALAVLLFCANGAAQCDAQEPSADAAALYQAGQFEQAASAYEKLSAAQPENPYYLYNLGNAYFKINRIGKAVACYRRAFELEPRDSDIRANLAFAMRKAGDELVPSGMPEVLYTLYRYLSQKELGGLFWLLCWFSLIPGTACLWSARARKILLPPALALGAGAAFCGLWLLARANTGDLNPAVVVQQQAEVRTGPGENFTAAASVPEGHTLDILKTQDDWYLVAVKKENLKGWVKASALEKI